MEVLKFGGTSVGSAERIRSVAALINDGTPKIVVLSAMSGTTNSLVEISKALYANDRDKAFETVNMMENKYAQTIKDLYGTVEYVRKASEFVQGVFNHIRSFADAPFSIKQEKEILAQGELMSTHLMQFHLEEMGVASSLIPALDYMRIDADGEPDAPYIRQELTKILADKDLKPLIITQGFICRNPQGEIDNLKRGGSDYSAALVGAAVRSSEIQIWTDIDGVHNNDPRYVEGTRPIRVMSYEEAGELAYFGAKILHPSSVLPAKQENIPVRIKNTMNPKDAGTLITRNSESGNIKAVAAKDGITAINIKSTNMFLAYGFLRKVFEVFEQWKTPIDMITTSEVAVTLTIDNTSHLDQIVKELEQFCTIKIENDMTIICVVGDFTAAKTVLSAQVLSALSDVPVRMIAYGGSEHNISVLVNESNKINVLRHLSERLTDLH